LITPPFKGLFVFLPPLQQQQKQNKISGLSSDCGQDRGFNEGKSTNLTAVPRNEDVETEVVGVVPKNCVISLKIPAKFFG
jgi:hypothetical protein